MVLNLKEAIIPSDVSKIAHQYAGCAKNMLFLYIYLVFKPRSSNFAPEFEPFN